VYPAIRGRSTAVGVTLAAAVGVAAPLLSGAVVGGEAPPLTGAVVGGLAPLPSVSGDVSFNVVLRGCGGLRF
jgi:hypothetical protein